MNDYSRYDSWFKALTPDQKSKIKDGWAVAYDACAEGNYAMVAGIIENILMKEYPTDEVAHEKPKCQLPEKIDKEWQLYIQKSIDRDRNVHYDLCSVVNVCVNVYDYLVRLYTPRVETAPNPEYLRKVVHAEEKRTLALLEELVAAVKAEGCNKVKFAGLLRDIAVEGQLSNMVHNWTQRYPYVFFKDDCPWYLRNIGDKCPEVKALM